MRKMILWVSGGILVIVACTVTYFVLDGKSDQADAKSQDQQLPYVPGTPIPAQAARTAQNLVANDAKTQRAAVTPELERVLQPGRLFAVGSRLELQKDSWHEEGGFANAQATLDEPGMPVRHVLLAFTTRDGSWRITLIEEIK
ncbi:hypothetical protein PV341_28930 [Streptomyces sp. PA03-1a]|nr:hypothetical protein [Streptomyces sp. PA03-1a]